MEEDLVSPRCGIASVATAVALISSFLFGYSICVLDSCGQLIPVVFEWCNSDWQSDCLASRVCQGLVNACLYLGAAIGALLVGRPELAARGSRFQICVSDLLFAGGALACCLAKGMQALLLGRFASGVGLGISAIAAPLFIAEVSPRERRGANAAQHGVFIAVGILCSIVMGFPQAPPPSSPEERLRGLDLWYWRCLLAFPVLPALLQAVLFAWAVPIDPPSLLVCQGRMREARELLYRTYGVKVPQGMVGDLQDSQVARLELQLKELADAAAEARAIPRIHISQAIFDPFLRCALLLGFGLAALQQLCGINALMSYSNSLFQEAGVPPSQLTLASTAMASANVFISVLSSQVVDNWGRRKLLLLGSFLQAVAMAIITHVEPPPGAAGVLAVACFSLFCVSFSAGLGAITWLYLSEIYPMEIRGSALSTCGVINWLSCFWVVFAARFLSLQAACQLFGIVSAVGWASVYLWVVETKGCSMDDSPLTPRSARSASLLLTPRDQKAVAGKARGVPGRGGGGRVEEDEDAEELRT